MSILKMEKKTRKRCPNGTRRNPKTGRCVTIKDKKTVKKTRVIKEKTIKKENTAVKVKKVCTPKKPLYNPVTNRCVLDTPLNRKKLALLKAAKPQPVVKKSPPLVVKKSPPPVVKKTKKVCTPKKPLYNPVTNRCVLDTPLNRKKIALLKIPDHKKLSKPVIVEQTKPVPTPAPKPTPKPTVKKCPENKPLYNPVTKRCIKNTLANMKKLGLELKQKTEEIKETKKYKIKSSQVNLRVDEADLLRNFDKVLNNMWKGTMYKIVIAMHYVLNRHKNACFVSGKIDTPQKRISYEKFNIIYYIDNDFYNDPTQHKIVFKKDDVNKARIRRNRKIVEFMTVPANFNLKQQVEDCKRNNKRFLVGLIYLLNRLEHSAHENSYIYDIEKQELELFEPNGAVSATIKNRFKTTRFYKAFLDYFKQNNIPIKRFYKPIDYCIRGPQRYDFYSVNKIIDPPGGYCAAWSVYYLDARLSNPNIPRDTLIRFMENAFRDDSAVFINSYTHYVFTQFLTNILDIRRIEKVSPTFFENFKKDRLTRNEKKFLNYILAKEMTHLLTKM